MRWLLIVAMFLVVACGGESSDGNGSDDPATATPAVVATATATVVVNTESPEDAVVRIVEAFGAGEYGEHWDSLHPAHQELVTREQYIACHADFSLGGEMTSVEAVESTEQPGTLVGVGRVDTIAVVVEVTIGGQVQNSTFHAIDVDGEWRWGTNQALIDRCTAP